jgi:hypothetical protein
MHRGRTGRAGFGRGLSRRRLGDRGSVPVNSGATDSRFLVNGSQFLRFNGNGNAHARGGLFWHTITYRFWHTITYARRVGLDGCFLGSDGRPWGQEFNVWIGPQVGDDRPGVRVGKPDNPALFSPNGAIDNSDDEFLFLEDGQTSLDGADR